MTTENKIIGAIVAVLVVIASFAVFYGAFYATVLLPKAERKDAEIRAEFKEVIAKGEYDICIKNAYAEYSESWELNCDLQKKGKDCSHVGGILTSLEDGHTSDKKECLENYEVFKK